MEDAMVQVAVEMRRTVRGLWHFVGNSVMGPAKVSARDTFSQDSGLSWIDPGRSVWKMIK
jgi:hypothetical protein